MAHFPQLTRARRTLSRARAEQRAASANYAHIMSDPRTSSNQFYAAEERLALAGDALHAATVAEARLAAIVGEL